jgi:hypothetical protein
LLGVVVGELHALVGDPVDVGRGVSHQTEAVGREVGLADIVAEDDQNVGFVSLGGILRHCQT